MMTRSQETAFQLFKHWYDNKESMVFKLGGPAGSGKSWLIAQMAEYVGFDNCLMMTPTGKASNNLIKAGLEAHTIHSQIYVNPNRKASEDDTDDMESSIREYRQAMEYHQIYAPYEYKYKLKPRSKLAPFQLFIVDEGSMVGGKLLADILSFNVPVLLVGDPNQLQPVNDTSVFDKCDYYLTEIVRQAQDSPVIWLSQQILARHIPLGVFGTCQVRQGGISDEEFMYADQVLADTNTVRSDLNTYLRNLYFKGSTEHTRLPFIRNDKIICRTNSTIVSSSGFALTNGAQGTISNIYHTDLSGTFLDILMDGADLGMFHYKCTAHPEYFKPEKRPPKIEHAYAITVHLSQGSEWNNVIYVVSNGGGRSSLYTAITRAKQGVLVTINK